MLNYDFWIFLIFSHMISNLKKFDNCKSFIMKINSLEEYVMKTETQACSGNQTNRNELSFL